MRHSAVTYETDLHLLLIYQCHVASAERGPRGARFLLMVKPINPPPDPKKKQTKLFLHTVAQFALPGTAPLPPTMAWGAPPSPPRTESTAEPSTESPSVSGSSSSTLLDEMSEREGE